MPQFTVEELIEFLSKLPKNISIEYSDPNFSGPYYIPIELSDFNVEDNKLLINFPFEEPCL